MWYVMIFQSSLAYSSYNSILFIKKLLGLKFLNQKNFTVNFQEQSFELYEKSIAASIYSETI